MWIVYMKTRFGLIKRTIDKDSRHEAIRTAKYTLRGNRGAKARVWAVKAVEA